MDCNIFPCFFLFFINFSSQIVLVLRTLPAFFVFRQQKTARTVMWQAVNRTFSVVVPAVSRTDLT